MNFIFDYDGVLSTSVMKQVAEQLIASGNNVRCVTSRPSKYMDTVYKVCEELGIAAISIGDLIPAQLSSKADYIKMLLRFHEEEKFMLFDNDPSEVVACLKEGILAVLVPSNLTDDMLKINAEELMAKI